MFIIEIKLLIQLCYNNLMMKSTFVLFAVLAVLCSAAVDAVDAVGGLIPNIFKNTRLSVLVHLQDIGDQYGIQNQWLGTKGQSRRLEGFSVRRLNPTPDFSIRYYAHLQNLGDTAVLTEG
jgi:hypothetical protein